MWQETGAEEKEQKKKERKRAAVRERTRRNEKEYERRRILLLGETVLFVFHFGANEWFQPQTSLNITEYIHI